MRSRAEAGGARRWGERALRGVAFGALAVALWRRLQPADAAPAAAVARADAGGLAAALVRWTGEPVRAVDVRLDGPPGPAARAWLAALASAGTQVAWRAARAPALAASAEPVADPAGGARLLVAAPAGAAVAARDALGPLDSARSGAPPDRGVPNSAGVPRDGRRPHTAPGAPAGAVVSLALPDVGRPARVAAGGAEARAAGAPAPRLGAVLVLGRAGWEAKFAAAALEERGWAVRTRFTLAPGVTIAAAPPAAPVPAPPRAAVTSPPDHVRPTTSAPPGPVPPEPALPPTAPTPRLDTATLAAVVALDSTAAPLAPAIARYVRAGGGLVLAGEAAAVPALAALAAAPAGAALDDSSGALYPLARPRADAVPLAWRSVDGTRTLVAAARRVGAGRVVQLADAESWRLRLRPADAADAEHRAWWAQAVAAAAYAPAVAPPPPADTASRLAPPAVDPAPLAATVDALGTPDTAAHQRPAARDARPTPSRLPADQVLIPLALAALLGEVASRRLRGAA